MTREQQQRVRQLFEAVVDEPAGPERDARIAREAGDSAVAREVASLLAFSQRAGQFMSEPLLSGAPGLLDEDHRFATDDVIGPYRIRREVGRGGMGVVYLATDTRLGRDVALKVLPSALADDAQQRERLRREARAASLVNHPGICTIYAFEEIGDECVISAEFVDGASLRQEITAGSRPSAAELQETAVALAGALAAAHARGVTHRDLKPENVIRAADGRLKILDFGLALVVDPGSNLTSARVTSPGAMVGTPAYMAPEQVNHEPVDARTDIFSLGVLLFEYATGVHPFHANTPMGVWARVLEGTPTGLASLRADLPAATVQSIERCLRRTPSERFASASELLNALHAPTPSSAPEGGAFWWRTHLGTVMALYFVGALASWSVLAWGPPLGGAGFVAVAMIATIGGVYRGHLLFAQRQHDDATFRGELRRSLRALDGVDLLLAALLVAEGVWLSSLRPVRGALISALGLGLALARLVLERSTTRATFGEP